MTLLRDATAVDLWPAAVAVLLILVIGLWLRKHQPAYLLCVLLFGIYLLFVIDKVFFPIMVLETGSAGRFWSAVNLIPFKFNLTDLPHIAYLQIFLNILLTVPFGFGVSFVARVTAKDILWLAPLVGLGIESGQLAISLLLGYPYRIIDINDVLLNALGVLIGYGLFRLLGRVYLALIARLGIEPTGLMAYIQAVIDQTHLPDHSARDS